MKRGSSFIRIRVEFDAERIRVVRGDRWAWSLHWSDKETWSLRWSDIERIGYRTTDTGPWFDDHFLVFKAKTEPALYYDVSLGWEGALALSDFVHHMPGTKFTEAGTLANCTENKSITVWPAEHTGEPM